MFCDIPHDIPTNKRYCDNLHWVIELYKYHKMHRKNEEQLRERDI